MHIAYYAPAWPAATASNGVVTYVATMRDQLRELGHAVSVIAQGTLHAADGGTHSLSRGMSPPPLWQRIGDRIGRDRGDHPAIGRRLAQELEKAHGIARFDLLEMEESFGWSRAAQAMLPVPVVTRLHGPQALKPRRIGTPAQCRQWDQRIAAEARAFRTARAVSAPTAATMAGAIERYAHRPAMQAAIFNPIPPDDPATRWHADPGQNAILFVGRFDRPKGADVVIDAFAKLAITRPRLRLILVGPDDGLAQPDGRRVHFADHVARVLPPAIRSRIEYCGTLPRARIAELRRRSAVTVAASTFETFHYAAVEAMAAGSPLICTAWPGSEEVVDNGRTGWLTPIGDVASMAMRIGWVLDNPHIAEQVGAAAGRQCRDRFAPDRIARQSLAFYGDVLNRYPAER